MYQHHNSKQPDYIEFKSMANNIMYNQK